MKVKMTDKQLSIFAYAVGQDYGNRNMRKNDRKEWNEEDWNIASKKFCEIYQPPPFDWQSI